MHGDFRVSQAPSEMGRCSSCGLFPKQASMLGQGMAEHVRISSQVLQSHQEGQKEPAPAIRHQPQGPDTTAQRFMFLYTFSASQNS